MKIKYDATLYREMAQFEVNKYIEVTNRKGHSRTIHITSIAKLTWNELQLLVAEGEDRFTKQILLYRDLAEISETSDSNIKGIAISEVVADEIERYVKIFRSEGCTKHHEVNKIITDNGEWDNFKNIRSLNDHADNTGIPGIQPKYFRIVCEILNITGEDGAPLDNFHTY